MAGSEEFNIWIRNVVRGFSNPEPLQQGRLKKTGGFVVKLHQEELLQLKKIVLFENDRNCVRSIVRNE